VGSVLQAWGEGGAWQLCGALCACGSAASASWSGVAVQPQQHTRQAQTSVTVLAYTVLAYKQWVDQDDRTRPLTPTDAPASNYSSFSLQRHLWIHHHPLARAILR
jgi:hypothetical protein